VLADEEGLVAGGAKKADVGVGMDAGLGDLEDAGGHFGGEVEGGFEVDFEVAKVAVVDADDGGAGFEGAVELFGVVDFDEGVEAELGGEFAEAAHFGGFEDGGDEEDGVGALDRGFVDLDFVDGEVLAQERRAGELRDLGEVAQRALEVFFVGEDGEAGRAAL